MRSGVAAPRLGASCRVSTLGVLALVDTLMGFVRSVLTLACISLSLSLSVWWPQVEAWRVAEDKTTGAGSLLLECRGNKAFRFGVEHLDGLRQCFEHGVSLHLVELAGKAADRCRCARGAFRVYFSKRAPGCRC